MIEQSIAAKDGEITAIRERAKIESGKVEGRLEELTAKLEEETRMLVNKKAVVKNLKISTQTTQSAESTQAERLQAVTKQLEEAKDQISRYQSEAQQYTEMIDHFTRQQTGRVHIAQLRKVLCGDCQGQLAGHERPATKTESLEYSAKRPGRKTGRAAESCPESCFLF